ncbi:MAG TPA: HAMP domain-containing sensor histidine kinase [Actinophytocola sp.]|uniref:HAMP domain-containing sensor histidine kinase n=1 Tax=Actinophytocola sp. TaxID=1872138 RepID=UPI002DB8E818|nr:HAMP domain-containing sensor histidine kinase [Actinophytocola sp.]HEU5470289.1 HAMP domain-containing sensor histidine kinase [Actinophytocola sp.]
MSSSPRGERRWSLRAKLTAQLVAVVAAVTLVISLGAEFALRSYLIRQLDKELATAGNRSPNGLTVGPPGRQPGGPGGARPPGSPPNPLDSPGHGPGTLAALFIDGTARFAQRSTDDGGRAEISTEGRAQLAVIPIDGRTHDVDVAGFGHYRVRAFRTPPGDKLMLGLPMAPVNDTLWNVGLILGGVSLAALLAAAGAGTLIVRRTLRPLRRVAATAGRVAELPLDRGEVALSVRVPAGDTDAHTEVGQVGAALNRMLGHIGNALEARQASETRVRRFVADASHELRTPLAAIRGYAELTRRILAAVPPDVAHAMRRVESESDRMTTLVEDLLLLARLDAGRPLAAVETDLSRLVVDAVSDARVAGPEHHWRLEIPPEPVIVTGDPQRLHQVLVNLLGNARTHTPPGTTVTAALSSTKDSTILTVTDDGPGIPAALLPDVFERFARGDDSRSRAAGSTGLGLSIVAGVVAAHHGTVDVASVPGRTVFTVTLPF